MNKNIYNRELMYLIIIFLIGASVFPNITAVTIKKINK